MGTLLWRGDAPAVSQVSTVTPVEPVADAVYVLTLNGKTVTFTDANGTAATVVDALVAAWEASAIPEFAEVTCADANTTATLTADTAGKPFTNPTVTVTGANTAAANEVQLQQFSTAPTGGTWTMRFSNTESTSTTSALDWNISNSALQAALVALPQIGANSISVTGTTDGGFYLEYIGSLANQNVQSMSVNSYLTPITTSTTTTITQGRAATTLTLATTTNSSGPNHWDTAANWSTGAVPVNDDTVIIENSSSSILYGIDANAVTLAAMHVRQSFTGEIGLARVNDDGSTNYYEYRDQYLKVSANTCNIGQGDGSGSGRIKINFGSNVVVLQVDNTGSAAETGVESVLVLCTHANTAIDINKGTVGIAVFGGEVSTVKDLKIGNLGNPAADATVRVGSGVTLTTIDKNGGVLYCNCNFTTLTQYDGDATIYNATPTTIDIKRGTVYYNGANATTITVRDGATLDLSQDLSAVTITTLTLYEGCIYKDPANRVTFGGNGATIYGRITTDMDFGRDYVVQITSL